MASEQTPVLDVEMNENTCVDLTAPHERPAADVAADLGTDLKAGLSSQEAQARLERDGPNELETEAAAPAWRRFLAQFKDALVLLLVAAAVISCAVRGCYQRWKASFSPVGDTLQAPVVILPFLCRAW